MTTLESAVSELKSFFKSARKHEAHLAARPILEQLSRTPEFLSQVIARHLENKGALDRGHYPVIAFEPESNPYFTLSVNCWIPFPGKRTDVPTKAIHHHGEMLLSTVTIFGPGYEHWLFGNPQLIDAEKGLYSFKLTSRELHRLSQVAFVDAEVAHVPFYPKDLSITLCLWSHRFQVSWKDRIKHIPYFHRRADLYRRIAIKAGLRKSLSLSQVHYYDFLPVEHGFLGLRDRIEHKLGPNDNYLTNVFHVLQRTGNEHLVDNIKYEPANASTMYRLISDLKRGKMIEGCLSECHLTCSSTQYSPADIVHSLTADGESNLLAER